MYLWCILFLEKDTFMMNERYRRRRRKTRQTLIKLAATLVFFCVVLAIMLFMAQRIQMEKEGEEQRLASKATSDTSQEKLEPKASESKEEKRSTPEPIETPNPEEGVYSYLQGPKSWNQGLDWSGEWGEAFMDGGSFGGFGCGLCCMANIYSTLTPYRCSPVDMYQYTKQHTGYGGGMAISWGYIRRGLTSLGFDCGVQKKPADYETFRKKVEEAECCLVLVSSYDSSVYWKDTPGHYVTIFLYDPQKEKVFLADSGNPDHNRHWVSLKKIYQSLKTSSDWQYITVDGYEKGKDNWRHKKTSGTWNVPDYLDLV